jgi:hypothetical protein
VPTSYQLGEIICNRDANGHIVKWSAVLGEFDIEFRMDGNPDAPSQGEA